MFSCRNVKPILLLLCVPLLIAGGCRSCPENEEPLGITVTARQKDGGRAIGFLTFEDQYFESLPGLLSALKHRGTGAVMLSSWLKASEFSADDYKELAAAFRDAGIRVDGIYGYREDGDIQQRVDFTAAPALKHRIALIDDTPGNYERKTGPMKEVKFITIHNTAEPFSALQERDRVNFRKGSTSFHYAVDEDAAVQILPLGRHGWHAGDGRGAGNMSSIGIEICRSHCRDDRGELYRRSENNAVVLAALLLDHYGLETSRLRMHQDWSGKFCPHRILEENRWDDFKKRVERARGELKEQSILFKPEI